MAQQTLTINGNRVWGQFLDQAHSENQHGIYGTSSAIQILAHAGYSQAQEPLKSATAALQTVVDGKDEIFPAIDLQNSFKLAYLLEAMNPTGADTATLDPLEALIVDRVSGRDAWGNHSGDPTPRLLPTAHLLIALSSSATFRDSPTARRAVEWLCNRARDDEALDQVPNAMALLAIISTRTTVPVLEELKSATVGDIHRRLALNNNSRINLENVNEHYSFEEGGTTRQQYMFYLRSSIVARAILAVPGHIDRSPATRVVSTVIENAKQYRGFKSPSTNRISTVDQLEVCKLLRSFIQQQQTKRGELLPRAARMVSSSTPRRAATSIALTGVGTPALYLTFASNSLAVQTTGGVISAVGFGLLATAIWAWTGGEP